MVLYLKTKLKKKGLHVLLCGCVGAFIALALWIPGLLEPFENATWSMRVRAFARPSAYSDRIKLILLDQDSLDWGAKENGWSWPWPREVYGPILQFLQRAGAKGIAFDVLYTEPSAYAFEDDEAFGQALAQTSNMVGALFLGNEIGQFTFWPPEVKPFPWYIKGLDVWLKETSATNLIKSRATFPIMNVATNVSLLGNVQDEPSRDGVFRRTTPFNLFSRHPVPSLGLGMYLLTHAPGGAAIIERGHFRLGKMSVPIDERGRVILRYRGRTDCYERFKAAAVIQSELRLQYGEEPVISPDVFKDCYVLFGFSAPALMDLRSTPVSQIAPGVFIHATFLDNLLAQDAISAVSSWVVIGFIFFLSLLSAAAALYARKAWQNIVVYGGAILLAGGMALIAYPLGYWYPMVVQLLAVILAITAAVLVNYATEGRQKQFIKKAFQHYLSGAVIERILDDPGKLQLGGERKELSIFFSDIQGFSTFSETMEPQELTGLLNEYLSAMTDIIFEEGGTLDKYEGDAIIAFWNAPLDQDDHALRACRAALRCRDKLNECRKIWAEQYGVEIFARIGIHTGDVVVGNMGSKERFDYTVLGDAANLASRLEGANKLFGTYLMVSETTWDATQHALGGRFLGRILVVGRKMPVPVYEPLSLDPSEKTSWVERYEEGLHLVVSNDWKKALKCFQSLESDPVSQKYAKQCSSLIDHKKDWDGIWKMTEK